MDGLSRDDDAAADEGFEFAPVFVRGLQYRDRNP